VKRLTIAAILALGIHGFLLGLKFDRLQKISGKRPKSRVINISLAPPRQAGTIAPKAAISNPKPKPKKHPVSKKIKKKPKHFPKPKPKKVIQKLIEKPEKDRSKAISEKTVELPKTSDVLEPAETKTVSKETAKAGETLPGNRITRMATPLYRYNPPPKYPVLARRRGFQGKVVLEVLVSPFGNVLDLRVLTSSGYPILDSAAKSSVKHWTFEPGMRGQEKVKMWVRVPIRFELK
jgi:protein TonB